MSKRYICDYDSNGIITLYAIDINNKYKITSDIGYITSHIESLSKRSHIEINLSTQKVTLTGKDITLTINNCGRLLDEPEFKRVSQTIIDKLKEDGYVNKSNIASINRTPKRNNKHHNSIITRVTPVALSIAIMVTSIAYVTSRKNDVNIVNSNIQIVETVKDEPDNIDLNNYVKQIVDATKEKIAQIDVPVSKMVEEKEEETITPVKAVVDFDDLSDSPKATQTKENYYSIIEKYSKKYGLDPDLVLSIATQEKGVHASTIDPGGGIGIMQIQYSIWINQSIRYYELNEETGEFEYHTLEHIDDAFLQNLETNIQLGCMILQECLRNANYNIPLTIQMYNMGQGTINKILDAYSYASGKTKEEIIANPSDLGWLAYRPTNFGDKNYLENVNKWADDNTFTVTNVKTGEKVSIEFTNEAEEARKGR